MTSFSIQSFGCRVNQAEAFQWADEFQRYGLKYEKDFFRSDFILINSCTLTRRADSDVRSFIRRISRMNPNVRLIVTGCYVDRAYEELEKLPSVWCIFSNSEKKDLTEKVLSSLTPKKEISFFSFRSRALVKIQDGCNFQCAFCIIPKVRGRSVSFIKEEILAQIKKFISQGFREVVLTGIHLCSYGLDLNPRSSLLELLRETENLEGVGKVRLSSLDPRFLDSSLLEYITKSEKICPHFHLSLQHGSDDILKRMGRDIKVEDYQEILSSLRQSALHASLGADIIVGFPGESEDDFEQTLRFLHSSPLTYFHVFSYSPRPGTLAYSWPQINNKIKKKRAALLRALSREKNTSFRQNFVGKECDGIVIKKEKIGAQVLTSNYFKVFVPSCSSGEKEEVIVKIIEANGEGTEGEIVP